MAIWKAHALADDLGPQLVLDVHDKVEAVKDLRGVPAGTAGVVILTGGFGWKRYRVRFANGAELGFLDAAHIKAAS